MKTLFHGDAFDNWEAIPDNSIDAVITDPPYGTTSCKWDTTIDLNRFWEQVERVKRDEHTPVVVFADQPFTSTLVSSKVKWFRHDFIWDKTQVSGGLIARIAPLKTTEDIVVFSEKKANYYWDHIATPLEKVREKDITTQQMRTAVLRPSKEHKGRYKTTHTGFPMEVIKEFRPVRGGGYDRHPTQKPVELMEYLVKLYSKEGDTILDPFMGSGSTGVAALNLNRHFVGIEQDEHYFQVASERCA